MAETPTEQENASTEASASPESTDAGSDAKVGTPIQAFADDEGAEDSLLSEFFLFLKEEKKWWLAPLILLLLGISAVILFAEGSAIAPFIYTVF